jgi:hypothetical protein
LERLAEMAAWTDNGALRYGARSGVKDVFIPKGQLWPLRVSASLPLIWAIIMSLSAGRTWQSMSPVDFVCFSSLTFIPVGIALVYQSPKRLIRIIGHCLYVSGFVGVAFAALNILAITFTIPTVRLFSRLGSLQFVEWMLIGGGTGLAYSYVVGRALKDQLLDEADAIGDFSSELRRTEPHPALLSLDKARWRRIARDYYKQCGKRALRLLRRSADPNFKDNYKAVATPDQFSDFERIAIYLRAAALGVQIYRFRRAIRYIAFGAAFAVAVFCGTWAAMRGLH